MTSEALEALKASIRHWEQNLAAEIPEHAHTGPRHCPLCQLFYSDWDCRGCPVSEYTGQKNCRGTPYTMADRRHREWQKEPHSDELKELWRNAAQAELDFLNSLLPVEPV